MLFILIIVLIIVSLILVYNFKVRNRNNNNNNNNNNMLKNSKKDNNIKNIQIFVFSWKKVGENAIKIFNEISEVFKDTWLIDCDENSKLIFNPSNYVHNYNNIIHLDDSAYYAKQFDTSLFHSKPNTIVGFVVGDINPGITDWKKIKNNIDYYFSKYEIGIYAPYEKRTSWQKSMGKVDNTNLYITDNTDCTVWFFSPNIVNIAKKLEVSKHTYYGWGIDIVLCEYSLNKNMLVVVDKDIEVINPDNTGYNKNKANNEINIIKTKAKNLY